MADLVRNNNNGFIPNLAVSFNEQACKDCAKFNSYVNDFIMAAVSRLMYIISKIPILVFATSKGRLPKCALLNCMRRHVYQLSQ